MKNNRGFSILELLIVMGIMGILTNMGYLMYKDAIGRSGDTAVISDARNLVTVATENFVSGIYPNFSHAPGEGSLVGLKPDGTYAFRLSKGVKALILGLPSATGQGYMEAYVFHTRGMPDSNPFGRHMFYCLVDEKAGLNVGPSF